MLAPKAFTQTVNRDGYIHAHLTADKRIGLLRFVPAAIAFAAIVLVCGCVIMFGADRSVEMLIKGVAALAVAAGIAAVCLFVLPERAKQRAADQFAAYDMLCRTQTVTMYADEMLLESEALTRRVEYAKTKLCIETPARFVVITDDDRVVILEKDCFTDKDGTILFFRDVFARHYAKGR